MLTARETVGAISVVVGAAVLAAVNHHPTHGRRTAKERAAVGAAAGSFTHHQIAEAWTQSKLGNPGRLHEIQAAFPLPPRSTYEEGTAVVLVFEGHDDICIDLISRPEASTVEDRRC